jgi:hypothetical protein
LGGEEDKVDVASPRTHDATAGNADQTAVADIAFAVAGGAGQTDARALGSCGWGTKAEDSGGGQGRPGLAKEPTARKMPGERARQRIELACLHGPSPQHSGQRIMGRGKRAVNWAIDA